MMSKFLPTDGFKQTDLKEFDMNKYTKNRSKGCVLELHLEYPKELRYLHNDYPLAADTIETKKDMLSKYHFQLIMLKIAP